MANTKKSTRKRLKRAILEKLRYCAVINENQRRKKKGITQLRKLPKLTPGLTGLYLKAKKEQPELFKELLEEVKESRKDKNNEHRSAGVQKTYDKPKPEQTRVELEKIAEEEEVRDEAVAQRELARRQLARRHLIASVVRFNDSYLAGWVHKDICTRLERFMKAVENGENPRLMLQMPPRHGKSTLASQEFPAFVLGHHPEWELIVCSYAETLALDFSRNVRERMRDKEYRALFPETKLDRDNQNAKGWKTTRKGGFLKSTGCV